MDYATFKNFICIYDFISLSLSLSAQIYLYIFTSSSAVGYTCLKHLFLQTFICYQLITITGFVIFVVAVVAAAL